MRISLPIKSTLSHFSIRLIPFSCARGSKSARTSSTRADIAISSSRAIVWSSLISRSVLTILLSRSVCSVIMLIVCCADVSLFGCFEELYKSIWSCITASGVRSSWAALAVNCLCSLNASDSRSSILLYETLSWFSSENLFSSIRESDRFCACTSSIFFEKSHSGFSAWPLIKNVITPPRRDNSVENSRLLFL